MKRIIIHWTAGSYTASALDRHHYHRLYEGDGTVVDGEYPISANKAPLVPGEYAAHTRNCNTDSIGVALCAMAGAREIPFDTGPYPITEAQWEAMINDLVELVEQYNIDVMPDTLLTHAEVEANLGIPQRGKWDVTVMPDGEHYTAAVVGDSIRDDVARVITRRASIYTLFEDFDPETHEDDMHDLTAPYRYYPEDDDEYAADEYVQVTPELTFWERLKKAFAFVLKPNDNPFGV